MRRLHAPALLFGIDEKSALLLARTLCRAICCIQFPHQHFNALRAPMLLGSRYPAPSVVVEYSCSSHMNKPAFLLAKIQRIVNLQHEFLDEYSGTHWLRFSFCSEKTGATYTVQRSCARRISTRVSLLAKTPYCQLPSLISPQTFQRSSAVRYMHPADIRHYPRTAALLF